MEIETLRREIDERMTRPSKAAVEALGALEGDLVIIGVAGKMGPSLALMARRAVDAAGVNKRIIGISRFSDRSVRDALEQAGVTTIQADLLNEAEVARLPEAGEVIFMAGQKFGTTGQAHTTWAINALAPAAVAERYKRARIVVFSSGNIYPLTSVVRGGATEEDEASPIGEYAQSVLARERIFEYFSRKNETPMVLYRLNYAVDVRYGVLVDIARAVYAGEPIDLTMGNVNVIWQGDANDRALRAIAHASVPPRILNITGPETLSVRWIAEQFGKRLDKRPEFRGEEAEEALLSNAAASHRLFGYPSVTALEMIDWIADWIALGGELWDKPTHFQERKGRY
ncbi:MAG: hypothetical protein BSOLF_1670 [Candidatus Carbobacillus altaicus]|uniref:NAD-dependent epimerase/dehydratase domain-containing protein n=1 Tax=Candidatus Carbonibacillus altaicus TaxID=2163959 RepID=A0A2R6Y3U4_9BACL|nr:MAG: hypothetical protein BSOLF_1670 [Candidatus Carbobacillus altaicus]